MSDYHFWILTACNYICYINRPHLWLILAILITWIILSLCGLLCDLVDSVWIWNTHHNNYITDLFLPYGLSINFTTIFVHGIYTTPITRIIFLPCMDYDYMNNISPLCGFWLHGWTFSFVYVINIYILQSFLWMKHIPYRLHE